MNNFESHTITHANQILLKRNISFERKNGKGRAATREVERENVIRQVVRNEAITHAVFVHLFSKIIFIFAYQVSECVTER